MRISLGEVRDVCGKLLSHVDPDGQRRVDISKDFYWNVPQSVKYDRYDAPKEDQLDVGQLSDDWERLQAILSGKSPPVGAALVWLGAILSAISEELDE
jgi:hypothetical protein